MTSARIGRTIDETLIEAGSPRPRKRRPNMVWWVIDDVGYGNLSPYGGLVEMPAMQRLVDRGMRFSNAHVTPLCSPTRACLLTGRNHHTNHMPAVPRWTIGLPGHDARIPRENGFLSEILLREGYATMCVGKWHLTSLEEMNPAASRDGWPLGRGFERFYGFMAGQTSQFDPHLCVDNHAIYPPRVFDGSYHLSEDLVDTGLRYVKELRGGDLDKPFFMYLAFSAGHAPHHAPREWIDRYRGKFDMGWDEYRRIVHQREQALGLVPVGSPLSERDPDVPAWSSLGSEDKRIYARYMEAFAGMCSHMDHHVGRFIDELDAMGELDDTIFLSVSDNGASSEGGETGAFNNQQFQGRIDQQPATLQNIDEIGGPNSYNHYPWGWAWAGNTPFRRWKRETYRGGCAIPFVLSWPQGLPQQHGNRPGFVHAIDVLPTILELLDIEAPSTIAGVVQAPIEGVSFASHLKNTGAPSAHRTQYFEMLGHRSLFHDGWRAVCPWPGPSFKEGVKPWPAELLAADLEKLENGGWELYCIHDDPAETRNLAQQETERLRIMVSLWWHEAGRYGVLPLLGRANPPPPDHEAPPTRYVFYPDTAPLFVEAAPNVINSNYRIVAEVELPDQPADGAIVVHGGRFGGYGLLVQDGRLVFVYNYLGVAETAIASPERLTAGSHTLSFSFEMTGPPRFSQGKGAPGVGRLSVDGAEVASGPLECTAPVMLNFSGMFTCGYHHMEPFALGYQPPFRFTGTIRRVGIVTSATQLVDRALEREVFLKRQ
jgi:arylsulfatase A-like enzyme